MNVKARIIAPVTALAAAGALAASMAIGGATPSVAAPIAPAAAGTHAATATPGVPAYNVTLDQSVEDSSTPVGLVLATTLTGKKLFTLPPPRGLSFAGITGAADDRTFVADAHRDPYGVRGSAGRSRTGTWCASSAPPRGHP